MPLRTLEEISEEYEGFKITGRIEYDDIERETVCHLTAKKKGFEDIRKSGATYRRTYVDLLYRIDKFLEAAKLEKNAQSFILIPLDEDDVFSGEPELFTKAKREWVSLEDPDEMITEVRRALEIYGHLWVPVLVEDGKSLTKPQIKKLDKLTEQARDVAVEFILTKAKEILAK